MDLYFGILWALFAAARLAGCVEITCRDIRACQRAAVGSVGGEGVHLNPKWVGHPAYITKLGELGYVRNMRAYSYGMDTAFGVAPDPFENGAECPTCGRKAKTPEEEKYVCTREPHKDRAHLPMDIKGAVEFAQRGEYSVKFHRTLAQMFGLTANEQLTIETGRPHSFTEFLRESCRTQKEAHYVLAALVLLSEGVDVPIETSGNRVIIKKRKDSEDVLVDARMGRAALDSGEEQLSEAWQVVNFFKQYRGTHKTLSTREDFEKGDFLESPQLLILTYVGEYVKNAKELMSVMECAFTLMEGMELAKSMEDPDSVVSRLFVPARGLPAAEALLAPLLSAQKDIKLIRLFEALQGLNGMLESEEKKLHRREWVDFNGCKRIKQENEQQNMPCVCVGVLSLFFLLAYDTEKGMYNFEALMEGAEDTAEAAQTQEFILKMEARLEKLSGSGPNNSTCTMLEASEVWNLAVVEFGRVLGSAEPGLLGAMRALAQITGRPQAVVDELAACQSALARAGQGNLDADAQEKVFALLRSLAVGSIDTMSIAENLHDVTGLSGHSISMMRTHSFLKEIHSISLYFSGEHVTIVGCSLRDKSLSMILGPEMNRVFEQYKQHEQQAPFTCPVFSEYINMAKVHLGYSYTPCNAQKEMQKAMEEMAEHGPDQLNRVFLLQGFARPEFKKDIVSALLAHAHQHKVALCGSHPIPRMARNIIGSTDLSQKAVQEDMLTLPALIGALETQYPTVQLSHGRYVHLLDMNGVPTSQTLYLINEDSVFSSELLMDHLRGYAKKAKQPLLACPRVARFWGVNEIECSLFLKSPARAIQELTQLALEGHSGEGLEKAQGTVRTLVFMWLMCLLSISRKICHEAALHAYHVVELAHYREYVKEISLPNMSIPNRALAYAGYNEEMKALLLESGGNEKYLLLLEALGAVCRERNLLS
ncbi:uncharacterized protein NEMAJ01_2007 [Nematocida major]|uniref:uncharacterized protein n=1 Tax=Nematocida major TaxID=1912982 RepID=UPI0020083D47|nr:uncharacterized protein NEMAJ01_2007 [Nematocida major]KAH9387111.1 hypothetical protein NEMAJ01_2007 [Nematocida major]